MIVRVYKPSAHFLECKEVFSGREDPLYPVTGREGSHFCTEPGREQYCIVFKISLLNKVLGNQKAGERDAGEYRA